MTPVTQGKTELFGLFLARSATMASPFVIFLALPPFYTGFWVQVEGAMPWLHGVAALAILGCALAAWAGSDDARHAVTHPLVLIPVATAAIALLLLPATVVPALSVLGAPEHGFGALAFLDLAALTASALLIFHNATWRRAVIVSAYTAVLMAFALDFLFRAERGWAPFFFSDYLGFYAVFAATLLVSALNRRGLWIAAIVLLVALAILSRNRALLVAIVMAGAVVLALPRATSPRMLAALCVAVPIAITAAILVAGSIWHEGIRDTLIAALGRDTGNALTALWTSLWSRAMLVVVGMQSLLEAPERFFVGLGWGHYNEALLTNLPVVRSQFFEFIGESRSYWDALQRSDFHSHNHYVEALLSSGVVGFALVLAYGSAVVLTTTPALRIYAVFIVLVLSVLQCLWFQMPHTLPVMAIAMAALVAPQSAWQMTASRFPVMGSAAGCVIVLLVGSGIAAWIASGNARTALQSVRADDRPTRVVTLGFVAGLSEIYHASLLLDAYARLKSGMPQAPDVQERRLLVVNDLLSSVPRGGPRTVRLSVAQLNVLSGLAFTLPAYEQRFGSLDPGLDRAVRVLLSRAPRRTDLAIPYFNRMLAGGREGEALALAESILAANRIDAVALWFSGIVLLGRPEMSEQGMQRLKASLRHRIQDRMPVPRKISQQIDAAD